MGNRRFIVADAGGTSTQWRVVDGERIEQFETIGFNAYTHDLDAFIASIEHTLDDVEKDIPVFLYAAGVDTPEQADTIKKALSRFFGDSVEVANDLIGVARALCGNNQGNVCILGTGANACYYDGEHVSKVSASLGYVLGDEGSGAYLGKKLMTRVFRRQLDSTLLELFHEAYQLSSHEVIQRIYHQPKPNHFLASFAPFIFEHRNHSDMHELISEAFADFFEAFFFKASKDDLPFYFSGSIAFYFATILREVAERKGHFVKTIVQSPISGLALYHQHYG